MKEATQLKEATCQDFHDSPIVVHHSLFSVVPTDLKRVFLLSYVCPSGGLLAYHCITDLFTVLTKKEREDLFKTKAYYDAVDRGDLRLLHYLDNGKYLYTPPHRYASEAYCHAAFLGRLPVVKWMCAFVHTYHPPPDHANALLNAIDGQHLCVIEYLWNHRQRSQPVFSRNVYDRLADTCNVDLFRFFAEHQVEICTDEISCHRVACTGHLGALQWLESRKAAPFWYQTSMVTSVASSGNLKSLQWIYDKAGTWNTGTFAAAVRSKNEDMVRWMHAQGCPYDESACQAAITEDDVASLKMLQWLRIECTPPCPWSFDTCLRRAMIYCQSTKVIEWLYEHRSPSSDPSLHELHQSYNLIRTALNTGQVSILECLFTHGYPLRPVLYVIAGDNRDLWAVKHLRARHPPCPWDESVCTGLVKRNYFETLKYVRLECVPRCPWNDREICLTACVYNLAPILDFAVLEQGAPFDFITCLEVCLQNRNCELALRLLQHVKDHHQQQSQQQQQQQQQQ